MEWQRQGLAQLANVPLLGAARQCGTITAIDLKVNDAGYLADAGPRLYASLLSRGVLVRPLGNTLYVMPPYCLTLDDVHFIYATIEDAVRLLT